MNLIFFALVGSATASEMLIEWARRVGGADREGSAHITVDSSGNLL